MRNNTSSSETLLISFASQEDEQSDLAALTMVRRISQTCTIMLIEDVHKGAGDGDASFRSDAHNRVRRFKSFADRLGLEPKIMVRELNEGIEDLSERSQEDVIVFHQPSFALDRQTQIFRRIERALIALPNSVLYTPADQLSEGRNVIAFARDQQTTKAELAEQLVGAKGKLETLGLEALAEIAKPQSQLRLQIQSQSPAMILIEEQAAGELDALYSRLAAVLSTPILVITHKPA